MKLLHTSDWHLGNQFNRSENRDEEFKNIFDWILNEVESEGIDLLLIAGDIFESPNPSNDTVKQYYEFIGKLSRTGCRHLVVIGGNHDSANRLDAPEEVFAIVDQLNIRVVGGIDQVGGECVSCAEGFIHKRHRRSLRGDGCGC